jgi:O-antigen/teichoic acid export membrane protein
MTAEATDPQQTVPNAEPGEDKPGGKLKLSQKIALNSSAQAGKQIFLAAAGIISVAIATRYLTVDQYGGVLAALVLVSLFGFATDFGIASMTVRAMARDPEQEVAISSSAFWVWVAFNAPTAVVILIVSQLVYPGAEGEVTRTAVLIMLSIFPLTPFAGVAGVRAVADQRVWITSLTSILARALSLAAVILAAVLDLGPARDRRRLRLRLRL